MKALHFFGRLFRALFLLFYNPRPTADPKLYRWATDNGDGAETTSLFN